MINQITYSLLKKTYRENEADESTNEKSGNKNRNKKNFESDTDREFETVWDTDCNDRYVGPNLPFRKPKGFLLFQPF